MLQSASVVKKRPFELSVIHINDFHARFEQIDRLSLTCSYKGEECFGGFSRVYSTIKKLKEIYPESLVLDAGDSFQGTLWYSIYKWKAVQYFMNKIPFDAHTIGNHEFDSKIAGLVPYLKSLKAPVVCANIDTTYEPSLWGLFTKSTIVKRNRLQIGIIGVIASDTYQLVDTERLKFLDEVESVNKEAERLVKEEDVGAIIVLSHSGYEVDKKIAKFAAPKISLIVGGHSHTLLYTGKPPNNLTAYGPYPTVVKHSDNRHVLVVQASAYTKFLGHLQIKCDEEGNVVEWYGSPIYLDNTVPQDPEINFEIAKWKETVDKFGNEIVGKSSVFLNGASCQKAECNLGNFITDAMIYSLNQTDLQRYSPVAFINSGAIRTSLPIGDITMNHLLECQPFYDEFVSGKLQGRYIKESLEHSANGLILDNSKKAGLLQISGIKVVYNKTKQMGSRVESVKIRCGYCLSSSYLDMDMDAYYTIVTNSYLANGFDGYSVIRKHLSDIRIGQVDIDVLVNFLKLHNPVKYYTEGRITIIA